MMNDHPDMKLHSSLLEHVDKFIQLEHFFVREVMLVKYSCAFRCCGKARSRRRTCACSQVADSAAEVVRIIKHPTPPVTTP